MTHQSQAAEQTNAKEEGDNIYQKFHTFDFQDDMKFQAGWSRIVTAVPDERREAECLKAKLFFYSKLYEKVTKEGYDQWLMEHSNIKHNDEDSKIENEENSLELHSDSKNDNLVKIDTKSSKNDSQLDTVELRNLDCKDGDENDIDKSKSASHKGDNLDITSNSVLDFSEIAEMIEKGLKLPGVEDLDIKPLDIDPNPPEMERLKKPWEK
ncbi:uncharacterized protein LOC132557037 [Ylistrum balloti]|uniref:uncharacterized protein LOC132557037 n=1 Tax=Ylistrum balloti TaxID=509963 RepID=UPI002905D555|nr:uncharacterized protein LOC132557037 [Ylistrum balloti]